MLVRLAPKYIRGHRSENDELELGMSLKDEMLGNNCFALGSNKILAHPIGVSPMSRRELMKDFYTPSLEDRHSKSKHFMEWRPG